MSEQVYRGVIEHNTTRTVYTDDGPQTQTILTRILSRPYDKQGPAKAWVTRHKNSVPSVVSIYIEVSTSWERVQ